VRSVPLILLVLPLAAAPDAAAQQRLLRGALMAAGDVPFAGAEVRVVGGRDRVCAERDGSFEIPVPDKGDVRLRITPVGFAPQDIVVTAGQDDALIALGDHVVLLEEVRVVGFSSSLVARESGSSIGTLTARDLAAAGASVDASLQGRIAGASVQPNAGGPGSGSRITLRGINTILGNTEPLLVVDGIILGDVTIAPGTGALTRLRSQPGRTGGLSDINPADVERIEVLRGPSAAALYGSRAGSGVIVITTKRGAARTRDDGRTGSALLCFVPTQ
jgi:TonB-dependent SusC/RagA subfamily outer membrane receptor